MDGQKDDHVNRNRNKNKKSPASHNDAKAYKETDILLLSQ